MTGSPLPVRPRLDRAGALATLRLFRERFWARAALAVVLVSVVFLLLGRWQWHRHLARVAHNDRVSANYHRATVPLTDLLATPASALPAADEWRPVRVSGRYDAARTVLVRNRPLHGTFGYEVLVPLRTADGALFLVDRGWIPNGQTGARPDSVPAPPSGQVEVVARLRPGEPPLDRTPPPGQALRFDLPRIAATLDAPSYRTYGVLATETPAATGPAPTPLPEPAPGIGPYLSYAVQWLGFTITAYVLLGYYAYREARRRQALAAGFTPEQLARLHRARRRVPEDEEDW